ncbi:MAG: SPOR domain-containing protein [Synergistaceae bacterium]|jgi:cell division septation protein DedD|nr:SPOR domain-containing protein [Synergistaceae bacterium]
MAATTRRTRNYKERSSMFAFGHFALPMAAIVALGLLFIGIKLFFLTPPEKIVVNQPPPVLETPLSSRKEPALNQQVTAVEPAIPSGVNGGEGTTEYVVDLPPLASEPTSNVLLAGPVGPRYTAPAKINDTVAVPKASAKPAPVHNTSRPPSSSPQLASANSRWAVQIGAFVSSGSASSLVDQIKKQGYKAAVSKADTDGTTYHRVRVPAGNSRESANKLAAELEKKGYPVAVVPVK